MAKIKIGVFGAGRGMTMIRQILHSKEAELVAVCDKYKPLLDACKREAEAAGLEFGYIVPEEGSNVWFDGFVMPKNANEELARPQGMPQGMQGGMPQGERPQGMPIGKSLNVNGGGVIFYGSKDTLVVGCYGNKPYLLSGREPEVPQVLRRVPDGHIKDFIRACKEDPSVRIPTAADFSESGPFNEMVVMGVLAVRLQGLNMTARRWSSQTFRRMPLSSL